jgi:chromosome segregation ATPase
MRPMLPYLLLIPAVASSVFWWRAEQGRRVAVDRVAQLEAARGPNGALLPPVAPPSETPNEPAPSSHEPKVLHVPTGTDPTPYLKTIDELREQVKEMSKDLSAARDEVSRADVRTTIETAEGKKLKVQLDEIREDLLSARRVSDALQAELRAKAERIVKAETSEKLMQDRAARAESAAAKVSVATKEIEDLNRRRESYLTSILRRFREVNDLYRNFTLAAQTRDTPVAGLQAGDLSRIQASVQQAEDDLHQLQTLNARMAQLARAK